MPCRLEHSIISFCSRLLIQMNGAWKMVSLVGVWTHDLSHESSALTTRPRLLPSGRGYLKTANLLLQKYLVCRSLILHNSELQIILVLTCFIVNIWCLSKSFSLLPPMQRFSRRRIPDSSIKNTKYQLFVIIV